MIEGTVMFTHSCAARSTALAEAPRSRSYVWIIHKGATSFHVEFVRGTLALPDCFMIVCYIPKIVIRAIYVENSHKYARPVKTVRLTIFSMAVYLENITSIECEIRLCVAP